MLTPCHMVNLFKTVTLSDIVTACFVMTTCYLAPPDIATAYDDVTPSIFIIIFCDILTPF